MGFIKDLYYKYLGYRYDKVKEEHENQWELIWGIKSYDDLSSSKVASLYTMNDIDITYDKESKKYYLGIETIYDFEDKEDSAKRYIVGLFNELTKWMINSGFDTNYKPLLWEVFTDFLGEHHGFDSVEALYGSFKVLVNGFY